MGKKIDIAALNPGWAHSIRRRSTNPAGLMSKRASATPGRSLSMARICCQIQLVIYMSDRLAAQFWNQSTARREQLARRMQ